MTESTGSSDETHLRCAVFLDRDGVINRKAPEGAYIESPDELELIAVSAEAIARLTKAGLFVVVVTNQRGVARGLMSAADLDAVHRKMADELAVEGASIDAIYACLHEKTAHCECRKPRPGMLLEAAQDHSIDLGRSWMIGDRESDMLAGKRAGCRTIRVCSGDEVPDPEKTTAEGILDTLSDAVDYLLATSPRTSHR